MNNNLNLSSDDIIMKKITNNLYWYNSFTLTARVVNDAPFLLQPIEDPCILNDLRAAAGVLYSMFGDIFSLIDSNAFYRYNSFTLTVRTVNDAPFLLQPIADL